MFNRATVTLMGLLMRPTYDVLWHICLGSQEHRLGEMTASKLLEPSVIHEFVQNICLCVRVPCTSPMQSDILHPNDAIWATWRFNPPATRLFVKNVVELPPKTVSKFYITGPFIGEKQVTAGFPWQGPVIFLPNQVTILAHVTTA